MNKIFAFLVILTVACTIYSAPKEGHIIFSYVQATKAEPPEGSGVWIGSSGESKPRKLWGGSRDKVAGALFSPDARKIGFCFGDSLLIMNNDGSNVQSYWPGPNWPPNIPNDKKAPQEDGWTYTRNGIFWVANKKIHRYIIEENRYYTLNLNHDIVFRRQLRMDVEGTKGIWLEPTQNKGMHSFTISSDLKSIDWRIFAPREKQCKAAKPGTGVWGHGNALNAAGTHVFQTNWCEHLKGVPCPTFDGHPFLNVFQFSDDVLIKSICFGDGHLPHLMLSPTESKGGFSNLNWRSPQQVINSDEYIIAATGTINYIGSFKFYIVSWQNPDDWIEIPGPHQCVIGTGWLGALPSPNTNTPFISLDKTSIRFDNDGVSTQTVTAKNTGGGALTKPSLTLEPSSHSWLTVSSAGAGDNSWEITASVDKDAMPDGEFTVTATVSGGGAENSKTFTISALKGDVLASPTGLTCVNTGAQSKDVTISWGDNSDGEEGFRIERKPDDGSWVSVSTAAPDKTSYVDANVEPGLYAYRMQAFKGSTTSLWSNEAKVRVAGTAFITVTQPSTGTPLIAGQTYTVKWTENGVTNIKLEYSADDGISWIPITETGGIVSGQDTWRNYPWTVPDISGRILLKVAQYDDEVVTIVKDLTVNSSASAIDLHYRMKQKNVRRIELFSLNGRFIARYHAQEFNALSLENILPARTAMVYVRYVASDGHILKKEMIIR